MTFTINDETLSGDILNQITIAIKNERITVKELIAARVATEVNNYNEKLPEYFKGLVKPSEAEKTLNGFKLKKSKSKIDIEKQTFIALNAFQNNGFFVLVDDKQVEDLEQEILINASTTVSFIKLTPLVGG